MSIFQAIIYGIIQGIGEFLPISSTAHLIVVPWLFRWEVPDITFDVALHLGTLVAVMAFFWRDWLKLALAGAKGVRTADGKLFWFLVAATIPGAIIGKIFEEQVESSFRNPARIGGALIIMGIFIYIVDKYVRKDVKLENIGFFRSFAIGISQAAAIVPGVSRSGITMAAGLLVGLTRESAAKFSFLLSTPIILGVGLLKLKDIIHSQIDAVPFAAAIITSAVVGFLSIKFLLDYLKSKGFGIFVAYRFVFGLFLIFVYFKGLRG